MSIEAIASSVDEPACGADAEQGCDAEGDRRPRPGGVRIGEKAAHHHDRDHRRQIGEADHRQIDAAGEHRHHHGEREKRKLRELERHR